MKRKATFLLRVLPLLLALGGLPTEADAAEPVGAMTEKARTLYTEGTTAMNQNKFAEAYASLRAAWSLNEHYQIAAHLGRVEVELGKYIDGVKHLRFAKTEGEKAGLPKKDQEWVQKHMDRALAQLGVVRIVVDPTDAEVSVGSAVVDAKERGEGVLVVPGKQIVSAKRAGYKVGEKTVDVTKGQQVDVALTLEKEPDAPPATTAAVGGPKTGGPVTPPPAKSTEGDDAFPRTELIWGGAAVGAVGLVGGVVTTVLANGAASDRNDAADALRAAGEDDAACSRATAPASCKDILDNSKSRDTYSNIALPLYVLGGAALAGTLLVVVLTDEQPEDVTVQPAAGPQGAGLWLSGHF